MEQLQPVIRFLKAHHFWVECGLVVLMVLGGWFVVTSNMATQTKDRITQIESTMSTVETISRIENHPNEESHSGMDAILTNLIDEVEAAWTRQYEIQEDVLVWPSKFSPEFLAIVERYKPIEKIKPEDPEPLDSDKRNFYRNYISDELPKLAEIIGAEWSVNKQISADGETTDPKSLVMWSSSNQKNLMDTRFSWPSTTPTTLEVLYAQEDLWVLTALMDIVRNTNGDVTARYQSAIKTLEFIDLGPDAVGVAGQVTRIGSASTGRSDMGGMGGMGGPGGMPTSGPPSGAMLGSGGDDGPGAGLEGGGSGRSGDPGDNRYVDKNYQPLKASAIRSAADSNKPEDAFLAVAKRIPVRMRMKIDQRKINRFLAECGSYKLPVEVHQVRINTPSGSTFRGGGGGGSGGGMMGGGGMGGPGMSDPGGMSGPGMDGPGMMSGPGGMGGPGAMSGPGGMGGGGSLFGGGSGMGATQSKLSDDSPWDVDLEIYGIIYIYNPVDRDKIGKKLDSAGGQPGSAAPGATAGEPAAAVPAAG